MRTIISPEIGALVSDKRRFEQIVLNLLGNAAKFTSHGEVVISADVVEDSQATGQPAIRVRVSDSVIGIRTQDLKTLFKPFRQIDSGISRKYDGTCLGLAISSRLAELMGGRIIAESQWGKGSTFTVILPLKKGSV